MAKKSIGFQLPAKQQNIHLVESLAKILSWHVDISRGSTSVKFVNNKWSVEYESYFNPHAKPYQLMDKKEFISASEAAAFFLDAVKEKEEHSLDCNWHSDWSQCSCGSF